MKKLYEGASVISAILLIVTTACFFIFKVQHQHNHVKTQKKIDKKIEKTESRLSDHHQKIIKENKTESQKALDYYKEEAKKRLEKEMLEIQQLENDIEYYKKMANPIWRYYDEKTGQTEVYSGKYNEYGPLGGAR